MPLRMNNLVQKLLLVKKLKINAHDHTVIKC